jgi:hypothetical protein
MTARAQQRIMAALREYDIVTTTTPQTKAVKRAVKPVPLTKAQVCVMPRLDYHRNGVLVKEIDVAPDIIREAETFLNNPTSVRDALVLVARLRFRQHSWDFKTTDRRLRFKGCAIEYYKPEGRPGRFYRNTFFGGLRPSGRKSYWGSYGNRIKRLREWICVQRTLEKRK